LYSFQNLSGENHFGLSVLDRIGIEIAGYALACLSIVVLLRSRLKYKRVGMIYIPIFLVFFTAQWPSQLTYDSGQKNNEDQPRWLNVDNEIGYFYYFSSECLPLTSLMHPTHSYCRALVISRFTSENGIASESDPTRQFNGIITRPNYPTRSIELTIQGVSLSEGLDNISILAIPLWWHSIAKQLIACLFGFLILLRMRTNSVLNKFIVHVPLLLLTFDLTGSVAVADDRAHVQTTPVQGIYVARPNKASVSVTGLAVVAEIVVEAPKGGLAWPLPDGVTPSSLEVNGEVPKTGMSYTYEGLLVQLYEGPNIIKLQGVIDRAKPVMRWLDLPARLNLDAPGWQQSRKGRWLYLESTPNRIEVALQDEQRSEHSSGSSKKADDQDCLLLSRSILIGVTDDDVWQIRNHLGSDCVGFDQSEVTIPTLPGETIVPSTPNINRLIQLTPDSLKISIGDSTKVIWYTSLPSAIKNQQFTLPVLPFPQRWILICGSAFECTPKTDAPLDYEISDFVFGRTLAFDKVYQDPVENQPNSSFFLSHLWVFQPEAGQNLEVNITPLG
jgi:hypothetical protein